MIVVEDSPQPQLPSTIKTAPSCFIQQLKTVQAGVQSRIPQPPAQ
jgi:hypothetical protein